MPGNPRNFRLFDHSYYYAYLAINVISASWIIKLSLPKRCSCFSSFKGLRRIVSLRPKRSLPLAGGQPSPPIFGVQQSVGTSSLRCRKMSRRPGTQFNPEKSNSHPTTHDRARITTLPETRFSSSPPAVQPFRATPTILKFGASSLRNPRLSLNALPANRSRTKIPRTVSNYPHAPLPSADVPTSLLPRPLDRSLASGGPGQPALVFAHERQCQCGGRF